VRLLVKNLGTGMPETVVREELEALDIHLQGVMQLRSGRRDQDPTKYRTLTTLLIVSKARFNELFQVPYSAVFECRCRRTCNQEALSNARAASASDP
jgi:hypothetical protein